MACETRTREINGETWAVTQMPPTEALALETKLTPVFLQGLLPVLSASSTQEEAQNAIVSRAITAMINALPPEEMAAIIKDLCSQCFRGKERVIFERDFAGGKGVMLRYRVAWFVLEVNFADFFGELLPDGVMDRAKVLFAQKMAAAESIGEAVSTGESGSHASTSRLSAA